MDMTLLKLDKERYILARRENVTHSKIKNRLNFKYTLSQSLPFAKRTDSVLFSFIFSTIDVEAE